MGGRGVGQDKGGLLRAIRKACADRKGNSERTFHCNYNLLIMIMNIDGRLMVVVDVLICFVYCGVAFSTISIISICITVAISFL